MTGGGVLGSAYMQYDLFSNVVDSLTLFLHTCSDLLTLIDVCVTVSVEYLLSLFPCSSVFLFLSLKHQIQLT